MRFYIMAGGSGSPMPPPISHIKLVEKETNLFVIPTSGINSTSVANEMFLAKADAIHLGTLTETDSGIRKIEQIVKLSKRFPGRDFL